MGKRTLLWLSLILIIAGVLRFRHLTTLPPGLFPDEAVDGNNALQALHSGDFKVFYTANSGEEGLFANVEAVVLAASGVREPWILRLPSAVFGMLTVLGVFFLARQLFRRDSVALLAAFFLATSFWHVNFSRIGFRAIMAPCFLVWAICFFVSSLAAPRFAGTAWRAVLAGALFGLGCYSYISYRITPLLVLLMIPFFWREQKFRRALALAAAVAFLAALPLGLYFLHNPADFFRRSSEVSVFSSATPVAAILTNAVKTLGMLDVHGDDNWRHNIAGRPELYWPVGIAFWIGTIMALVALFRRNGTDEDRAAHFRETAAYLFCIAWIALAALPAVFSDEGLPHALRAILMIPPIMMLAAVGGVSIHGWATKQLPGRALLLNGAFGAMLIWIMGVEGHAYLDVWAERPETAQAFTLSLVSLSYSIRAVPDSTPKYIVIQSSGATSPQVDPWDAGGRTENLPIAIQTVMFLTDSYLPQQQRERNIHYVLMQDKASVPADALTAYVTLQ